MTNDKHMMRDKQWEALQLRFVESWTPCEPDTATEKRADKELTTTTVNCLGKKLGERAHIRLKGLLLCWCFLEIIWAVSKPTKGEKNVATPNRLHLGRLQPLWSSNDQRWVSISQIPLVDCWKIMKSTILDLRPGLKVCLERNEWRLEEAHFTEKVQCFMTLVDLWVTMFQVIFFEKISGKANPERTSCVSAFSRLSLF